MEDSENIYKLAFQYARLTNCNLFITGKAGSGKTTLIRNFCQTSDKNIAITAPTGVAAINAGGVTLHSLFQLPLQPFVPTETGRREFIASLRVPASKRRLLYNLDTLIIDEISMVRADVLDAIDTELQHFRGNRLPFGGVQVILLGDLHQLSPVSTDNDMQLLAPHYPSMYFFSSRVIENHPPLYIQFDHIYRQSDPKFIDLLNAIRDNCLTQAHYRLLDTLYHPGKSLPDDCIVLTTHNQKADSINAERLKAIRSHERKFHAAVNGDFPEKNYATDETLVLKKGARVMFLRNNQEKGYYNGKTGIVTDFIGNHVEVRCDEDGKSILVEPEVWSNVSYTVNSTSGAIESHVQGTFTQIPLRLAWAITIHKSQGLTFNKVAIDAAQSFASGQVYVALSRCRSLEGLRLLSPISAKSLRHDQAVSNYDRQRQTVGQLQEAWEGHTHQFQLDLLTRLYDFSLPIGGLSRLIRQVADASNNWSEDTMPFLTSLKDGLVAQQAVALSFQQQLESHLRKQWDEHWVGQRLVAASQYFTAHLQQWIQAIRNSPVRTDSKPLAATYNDALRDLHAQLYTQEQMMKRVAGRFSATLYFAYRKTIQIPAIAVNAYNGEDSNLNLRAKYPALYQRLAQIRRFICDETGQAVYRVASTQGLVDAASYLPLTAKDLLRLPGFGPKLVQRYGDEFLDAIREFCQENNLISNMLHYTGKPKKAGRRKS